MSNHDEQLDAILNNRLDIFLNHVKKEMEEIRAEMRELHRRVDDDYLEGEDWKKSGRENTSKPPSTDDDKKKPKPPTPSTGSAQGQENIRIAHELEQAEARVAEREGRIVREAADVEPPAEAVASEEPKPLPTSPDHLPYFWYRSDRSQSALIACRKCHELAEQTGLNILRRGYCSMASLAAHLFLKHQISVPLPELIEFQEGGVE